MSVWRVFTLATLVSSCAGSSVMAVGVGEPLGFTIQIQHGSTVISKTISIGPGQDLEDIKISDGDPESYTQIGTLPGGSPIILKVVSQDDALYRMLHMFILAPVSMLDINTPGPVSLFNPSGAFPIDVSISGMVFDNGAQVQPQMANTSAYFSSYMRDREGKFYQLSQANAFNSYGHGVSDIQVGADKYLDGFTSQYNFVAAAGSPASFGWMNMVNPGMGTPVHNGFGLQTPTQPGFVFELGLSVAFTAVPESGTLALLAIGGLALSFTRSRSTRRSK